MNSGLINGVDWTSKCTASNAGIGDTGGRVFRMDLDQAAAVTAIGLQDFTDGLIFSPPQAYYTGGANAVEEQVIPVQAQSFVLDAPSSGPNALLVSNIKAGTTDPETPIVKASGADIIDLAASVFEDLVVGNFTYRIAKIYPTQDLVTGSAVAQWTWKGKTFTAPVVKTVPEGGG
jgi:hypothetical protein